MLRYKKLSVQIRGLAEMAKKHYNFPPEATFVSAEMKDDRIMFTFSHPAFEAQREPEIVEEPDVGETGDDDEG